MDRGAWWATVQGSWDLKESPKTEQLTLSLSVIIRSLFSFCLSSFLKTMFLTSVHSDSLFFNAINIEINFSDNLEFPSDFRLWHGPHPSLYSFLHSSYLCFIIFLIHSPCFFQHLPFIQLLNTSVYMCVCTRDREIGRECKRTIRIKWTMGQEKKSQNLRQLYLSTQ